jgi:hypothetical protein
MAGTTFGANASNVSVAPLGSGTVVALWRDSNTQRVNATSSVRVLENE